MHTYNLLERVLFLSTRLNEQKLMAKLEGKTVLITGASSGIGEQVAYLLANTKAHLILVARRENILIRMKSDIEKQNAKVTIFSADLRKQEETEALLDYLHQLPLGLDVLVSNAGLSINRSIYDSLERLHDFTRTMAINYFAPVQLLLSVIPLLQKNKGQIINVSTINTLFTPIPFWAAYQASKSAFDTWFRSVAPELNVVGIATTTIYLPLVKTPMIAPTAAYSNMPAMCPRHVAKIIGKTMYTHQKKYVPWWGSYVQFASIMLQGMWERYAPFLLRKRGK